MSKNLILSIVFVFAGLAMVNANVTKTTEVNCIKLAYDVDKECGGISYEVFLSIVENCEEQQGDS
ncbi:hypothetical protein [Lutibacter sp.]|uniref:hypothetical protein n=1 Tax=Lutibacter sp. TaxID=1925666 RepID=UPI0035655A98